MKHALLILKPPYATQIINQLDGSLMIKFELSRKQELLEMLANAFHEAQAMTVPTVPVPEPIQLKGRMMPLKDALPEVPVSKVEPDFGMPPMRVVAPPPPASSGTTPLASTGVLTVAKCEECGAQGSPSSLIHLESCSSFKQSIDVDGGPAGT